MSWIYDNRDSWTSGNNFQRSADFLFFFWLTVVRVIFVFGLLLLSLLKRPSWVELQCQSKLSPCWSVLGISRWPFLCSVIILVTTSFGMWPKIITIVYVVFVGHCRQCWLADVLQLVNNHVDCAGVPAWKQLLCARSQV